MADQCRGQSNSAMASSESINRFAIYGLKCGLYMDVQSLSVWKCRVKRNSMHRFQQKTNFWSQHLSKGKGPINPTCLWPLFRKSGSTSVDCGSFTLYTNRWTKTKQTSRSSVRVIGPNIIQAQYIDSAHNKYLKAPWQQSTHIFKAITFEWLY